MTLWEESTRVPLIIAAPGATTPGSTSVKAVSLMDMYPTLAELAGIEVPGHVEGRSLLPLIENPRALWDYPAVTTYGFKQPCRAHRKVSLHPLRGRLRGALRPRNRSERMDQSRERPRPAVAEG